MTAPPLARVIAEVATALPPEHVAAWQTVLRRATGPTPATEAALVNARSGYAVGGHARHLVAAWRDDPSNLPGAALALALDSAAMLRADADESRTDLVVSGPTSEAVPVRHTAPVVVEVIRAARDSLLVVSFAAYGVTEVVRELVAAAGRGVRIDLILEGTVADGGSLRGQKGAAAAFADLRRRATFWHWPATRRPVAGTTRAAMHAKIIVADTDLAMISSANLTDRALAANLEIGVILRDHRIIQRLVAHFTALMRPDAGHLERLP